MDATVPRTALSKPRVAMIVFSAVAIGAIAALYGLYLNRHAGRIVEAKILLGWLIAVAGLAVVGAAQMAAPVRPRPHVNLAERQPHPDAPGWQSQLLRPAVGLLSGGAALIHFAVIGEHFDEFWLFGLFFIGVSLFQLAWAIVVVIAPARPMLVLGAVANLLVAVVWAVSRIWGLPIGPDAGKPVMAGFGDAVSTIFEVLIFAGALLLASGVRERRPLRLATSTALSSAIALVIVAATALALISAVGGSIFVPPSG